MAYSVRTTHRRRRKPSSKTSRKQRSLQKPNGVISHRVQKVGGEVSATWCSCASARKHWASQSEGPYCAIILMTAVAFVALVLEGQGDNCDDHIRWES